MCLTSASDDTQTHLRVHQRTHTCAHQHADTYLHANPPVTTVITNAVSVWSNFISCILYFNNMSMICQNMPACVRQGNKGKRGNGVGLGDVYAHVWGYEFTSESRSRSCRKLFTSSIPSLPSPCCFKRLLLRQSAGICLQNCYVRDRDVNHALHVLYWISLCDESA